MLSPIDFVFILGQIVNRGGGRLARLRIYVENQGSILSLKYQLIEAKPMENLLTLLFELSSEERTSILNTLSTEKLRLSEIARRGKLTATEASRHLQRLSDAMLIRRDSEGLFDLTKYGELSLSLLDGLTFTSAYRDYFNEHDASVLPSAFKARLGDLRSCTIQKDFISTLAYDEQMFKEADSIVWAMSDQFHYSAPPIVAERIGVGVDFRTILPENIVPPPGFKPTEGVTRKYLPRVDFHLIVTDKEAAFGLAYLDGRMDYAQFVSKEKRFREWCFDLFQYYWDRAKPLIKPF
jgi:predicted transcriptional regulator